MTSTDLLDLRNIKSLIDGNQFTVDVDQESHYELITDRLTAKGLTDKPQRELIDLHIKKVLDDQIDQVK